MFPDNDTKSQLSQPHMYPERVVINLEERLRAALASNEELEEAVRALLYRLVWCDSNLMGLLLLLPQLKAKDADMASCLTELSTMETRLKRSEENFERIRHSLAWMQQSK